VSASARIDVYVQPRASKTTVAGMHDGAIKIRLAAPPVDGAANAALIEFIAKRLGVSRARVRIAAGETSRRKVLEIDGVEAALASATLLGSVAQE
jgi:uncharacterized protein (TIGR00251 family)